MRVWRLWPALFVALAVSACGCQGSTVTSDRPLVFVSLPPQAELVRRVAGDLWDVEALLPTGQSPATYDATPRQLSRLAEARIFVRVGAPFENGLLDRIAETHPGLTVVDQRERVTLLDPDDLGKVPQSEADHADHHVWLDPKGLQLQAGTIRDALAAADPKHASQYAENLKALVAELDALDNQNARKLHEHKGGTMFVHHPAYAYFAHSYGLAQVSIEEHGREPSARRLAELTGKAREKGWKTLFVQREFSDRNARLLAESVGAEVVVLDPLAPDLLANLAKMADTVAARLALEE